MGKEPSQSPVSNGSNLLRRFSAIQVNAAWADEAQRNLLELQRLRVALLRFERLHPEAFQLLKSTIRGVDMRELGMYYGAKVNNDNNGLTSS